MAVLGTIRSPSEPALNSTGGSAAPETPLPFLAGPRSGSGEPLLGRFLGAREEPVLFVLPDLRAAAPLAVLVTAATAAAAAALTVAGLAPFSMEGESAGPIMSMLNRVSAAAIPAPGDPMRSSAADCTVPMRCGGGVAVAGRPASASTAAVRCGGSGSAGLPGLGAWMRRGCCVVGVSSGLMSAGARVSSGLVMSAGAWVSSRLSAIDPLCGSGLTSPGDSSRRGFTFSDNVFVNPRTLG